jgi:hypothetical protein
MGFTRYGTPEPMKVVTVCEDCKQDRPLMKVTVNGVTKNLCAVCLGKQMEEAKQKN